MNTINRSRLSVLFTLLTLAACTVVSPIQTARTVEQRAYALYAEYTIAQGAAVRLVQDPAVPESVKKSLRQAEAVAYPVADQLAESAQLVTDIRETYVVGVTPEEKLNSAIVHLSDIYFAAKPQIQNLVLQTKAAKEKK